MYDITLFSLAVTFHWKLELHPRKLCNSLSPPPRMAWQSFHA